jgi:arylsulfatase
MYHMPQMSPMPAHVTVEGWAAQRALEQIADNDKRPYFGFVSFIGPHPPIAPPIPFNRIYDPDCQRKDG